MKYQDLKSETEELVANSIAVYYALKQKNKLYREDSVVSLSLYCGVLRMGKTHEIKSEVKIGGNLLAGLPIEDRPKYDSTTYEVMKYDYKNVVCQILNEYGITIERVAGLLNLDKKLLNPVSAIDNKKLGMHYDAVYKSLLTVIHNYYIESARIKENIKTSYKPEIDMTVPNIISALYYPNIDPYSTISYLCNALGIENDVITKSLEEIQKYSIYKEGMCRIDKKTGLLKNIYQVNKPLVMNRNLGRIL